jgi:hypothetical protein
MLLNLVKSFKGKVHLTQVCYEKEKAALKTLNASDLNKNLSLITIDCVAQSRFEKNASENFA